jgi:glycosyltransferase involved in cell wall biosynthesis
MSNPGVDSGARQPERGPQSSQSKSRRVSVVIPCFNHGEFLPEAVASAANLRECDIELVVVDDGSTDERTRMEMDRLAVTDGIRVIRQGNKGLAAARNAGIQASRGEYILPLDADNRLRPGIEQGIRILESNPQVGVVYGDAEYFGASKGRSIVGRFEVGRLLFQNYIDACALYRRAVWEQNGGYDGTMPVQGFEDWDFWLGALERGWQFAYVPEVLFDYRQAAGSMITRTRGFESQVEAFVGTKHGFLYQRAWRELEIQRMSVKSTYRNLARLLKSRFREKLLTSRERLK